MRWWPRGLAARLAIAASTAVAVLVAMQVWFGRVEAARRAAATRQTEPGPAAAVTEEASPMATAALAALQPVRGRILLATNFTAVPAECAPVVQVFADGGLALRRPAPLPSGPLTPPATEPAILLPAGLAELGPAARGALLALLARLIPERPVSASRLVAVDATLDAAAVARLLAWLP